EKTWDYVVLPLAAGTQQVPPVRFSYFDPKAAQYRTVESKPLSLQVARGEGGGSTELRDVAQSDVRLLRRDIYYLKSAPGGLRDRSPPLYITALFAALVEVPAVRDLLL